ncbi:MAG: hypothetical protein IKL33_03125 [Alphaproteobacteria bacterium]|nr:hypothetical protein [Alphaproteobacteria bacterium]
MKQRIIALIDCDSFFVSCERVDNPNLQDKPVCVMTGEGNKGIVVSRSREAKALGIKMGAPYFQVAKTHPQAIYVPSHHHRYSEISHQVMNVIRTFSPDVEEVSIDEAYIDLTGLNLVYKMSYTEIIKKIRQTILEQAHIPVSIGLSCSKTLAKLASDKAKTTNGIFVIRPDKIIQTIGNENIEDICGIGHQSTKILKFNGIFTVQDFLNKDNYWIKQTLGIHGLNLKMELLENATSFVDASPKAPQSIQDTKSFEDFTDSLPFLQSQLQYHIHQASGKLRKWNGFCEEIGVILRYKDFSTTTLYRKISPATNSDFTLKTVASELLNHLYRPKVLYRSLGIELKKISYNQESQQSLFDELKQNDDKLSRVIDNLEQKFGKNIIKIGL